VNVLIVSFLYPPFNSITGLGVSKISRYLLEQGWDVRVLCGPQDDVPAELPVEIPAERVTRTAFFDVNAIPKMVLGRPRVVRRGFEFKERGVITALGHLYRNFVNFPDGQIGWYPFAVRAGSVLIREARPDVILAVGTPRTGHLVARTLSRRFGIPWVARNHDLWADSRARGRIWPLGPIERRLEDRTTSTATMIVTVAYAWRDQLAARFPAIPVGVVEYGFEPADFPPQPAPVGLPLLLAYTGRLYPRQDPGKLFAAVRLLLDSGRASPDELRVRFAGRYLDIARRALEHADLPDGIVTIEDPLPHDDAIALQQQAGALVLFLGEDDDVGLLPAKMYEYMGAGRPVLVIGGTERHEGVDLLRRAGVGTWAPGPEQIADVLSRWLHVLRRSGRLEVTADPDVIRAHEWRSSAAMMGDLLREAIARHDSGAR
jgi:glycosyltransferase involved in cell wall biosynthesis